MSFHAVSLSLALSPWPVSLDTWFSRDSLPLTFISVSSSCLCPRSSVGGSPCGAQCLWKRRASHLLFLLFTGRGVLCDEVTQRSPDQTVASGSKVTLLCTYYTTQSNPDLYWYRVRPDRAFQFILYRDNTLSKNADFTGRRFSVLHDQSRRTFHLVISPVEPEDSATYYCAMSPHSDAGAQEV